MGSFAPGRETISRRRFLHAVGTAAGMAMTGRGIEAI
jgi:hypothetical protein